MRHKVRLLATIVLHLLFVSIALAQTAKVEEIGSPPENALSNSIRQNLEAKGYRLLLDDAKAACELWLRKSVPSGSSQESDAVVYSELSESEFLGVIHFPEAASDFRGHKIPAGFYTMRYELLPEDGNHMGAAPNRDFALLIPADSDPDPSTSFKYQELVALSARTAGTKHPTPLSLVPNDKPGTAVLTKDDQDHWIFSTKLNLASGKDLPFALIVKGEAQQ